MNIIEVQDLTKTYGKKVAVNDISFNVAKGEIFGMLGPNGAGKTTTIECITGLKNHDKGRIDVMGISPSKERKALYDKIGVQLQETSFQPKIKVNELCRLFASFYKDPCPYDELISRFSLEDKRDSFVQNLSGGQRQKLSIILALISNPEIVFLDELTTGLDPSARRSMWAYVKDLKEEGRTVFMTTHYMEEAEFLCDRICIINGGKIIAIDTVENIVNSSGIETEITFDSPEDVSDSLKKGVHALSSVIRNGSHYCAYSLEDKALGKLVYWLETNNVNYRNLNLKRPTLDDTFLKLTGRKIEEV